MLVELDTVGSTNDWLAERKRAQDGLWVRANSQTGGRGRRGRLWVSEPGNLYASTLARHRPGDGPAQQLSFIAALALADALDAFVPAARITLKWPNDALLDGVKCAGILLEGDRGATIVGFGVNLAHHPDFIDRPATSLKAAGLVPPQPAAFLEPLRASFAALRDLWRDGGFQPIRKAWMARAAGQGAPLVARLGSETVEGVFEGLAEDGGLQLRLADGTLRTIRSGEVFTL